MKTKFNGILTLLLALVVQFSFAQEKTVTGTVTDENGTLPGVSVIIKGTSTGSETDFDGKYTIKTKAGDILSFSYLGYTTVEKTVGSSNTINVTMQEDANLLDEIVVTGVAVGTSTKKLGFTVSKVNGALLEEVPAANASNALRGKVAGINIFQTQGNGTATVSLRGAKSVFGNSSPLILIDGIITNQSLGDINTTDIETIEVIKGAAASSMYGSRAAGGVIQIITKKGKRGAENITVSFRTESGINSLERKFPVTTKHPYLTDASGKIILNASGQAQVDPDGKFDGDYYTLGLPTYDLYSNGIENAVYQNHTLSVSGGGERYNYYLSFDANIDGGVVSIIDADKRNTVRANFDFSPTDKLKIGVRTSYTSDNWNNISTNGRSSFWGSLLTFAPFVNVLETDADGDYKLNPSGAIIQNIGSINPWYGYSKIKRESKDNRFVGGLNLDYKVNDKLTVYLAGSVDKYFSNTFSYWPKGYKTLTPNPNLNRGQISFGDSRTTFSTASAMANYKTKINDDLTANFTAKYLIEHQSSYNKSMTGSGLSTEGVYDISKTDEDKRRFNSSQNEINAQNFFVAADFDYKDKLILNGLVRRDGSSLFGANERWQTYYRASLAYRLSQDLEIKNIQEFKVRASYGTAGRRPGFSYQYEIANVGAGGAISFNQTGNPNLKPSENRELEFGVDIDFLNRFHFTGSYSKSSIKNDFINRNLPSSTSLFNRQWQNLGSVDANTLELYLDGTVMEKENFSWKFGLAFDTSTSNISDLGDILPYTNGLYRIEKDKEVGTMYGNWAFKSLSEITVDANNIPTNIHTTLPAGTKKSDLVVNNMGFVVLKSSIGTPTESVLMAKDEAGNLDVREIGRNTPDFKLGLSNTFKYGNIGLYVLLDYKNGGNTYNASTQDLLYNDRSSYQSIATEKGHHSNFAGGSSNFYNANNFSNAFVENSTYLKLREVALSYDFDESILGNTFKDVKLAIVGRNLFTITDYTGWNPETSYENYVFPLYRTFSATLTLKF